MKYLFIINDSPYGTQRTHNGLRLAVALSKQAPVRVFLLGDGVTAALTGFNPAHADYNPQEMLKQLGSRNTQIGACKTCLEARGISDQQLIPEVSRSTMDDLVAWSEEAEKVFTF